jgi:hypothetical protein
LLGLPEVEITLTERTSSGFKMNRSVQSEVVDNSIRMRVPVGSSVVGGGWDWVDVDTGIETQDEIKISNMGRMKECVANRRFLHLMIFTSA